MEWEKVARQTAQTTRRIVWTMKNGPPVTRGGQTTERTEAPEAAKKMLRVAARIAQDMRSKVGTQSEGGGFNAVEVIMMMPQETET